MEDHKWRGAERAERQAARRLSAPAHGGTIDAMASAAADMTVEATRRELQVRVLGFVSRRVRSREDAEDIAHRAGVLVSQQGLALVLGREPLERRGETGPTHVCAP